MNSYKEHRSLFKTSRDTTKSEKRFSNTRKRKFLMPRKKLFKLSCSNLKKNIHEIWKILKIKNDSWKLQYYFDYLDCCFKELHQWIRSEKRREWYPWSLSFSTRWTWRRWWSNILKIMIKRSILYFIIIISQRLIFSCIARLHHSPHLAVFHRSSLLFAFLWEVCFYFLCITTICYIFVRFFYRKKRWYASKCLNY